MIPDNLFEATFSQVQTKYRVNEITEQRLVNGTAKNITVRKTEKYLGKMSNPNIIGI